MESSCLARLRSGLHNAVDSVAICVTLGSAIFSEQLVNQQPLEDDIFDFAESTKWKLL